MRVLGAVGRSRACARCCGALACVCSQGFHAAYKWITSEQMAELLDSIAAEYKTALGDAATAVG